jgi:hypothetical protein
MIGLAGQRGVRVLPLSSLNGAEDETDCHTEGDQLHLNHDENSTATEDKIRWKNRLAREVSRVSYKEA